MQSFISVEAQEKKKALLDILKKDADSSKGIFRLQSLSVKLKFFCFE